MTTLETERPDLRTVPYLDATVELAAATEAARDFLEALGVDCEAPGTLDSARRMAQAYFELLTAPEFTMTTFPNDGGYEELILVSDLPVTSVCEHHLLPFTGLAHIGYLPSGRLLGLSKFARAVDSFARRPQVQERLTSQLAHWLDQTLTPRGVGVIIEANHSCMSLRGAAVSGSSTRTTALTGAIREHPATRAEFLSAVADRTRRI